MATSRDKLDSYGVDAMCNAIVEGDSMTLIAKSIGVSLSGLIAWVAADHDRSARVREARISTAQLWDERATSGIEAASDVFELSKAKEIAHHYRWRASKIAPREYGDKVAIGGADDLPPIETKSTLDVAGLSTAALAEIMSIKDASGKS